MARIKIKDLPRDRKISKEKMRKIMGGNLYYDELPSVRLQYTMDRKGNIIQVLSNLGGSLYQSQENIIDNLK